MGKIDKKQQLAQQLAQQYAQLSFAQKVFYYFHDTIMRINDSKIFSGIMIITLNIASRFVTIKLSPSMEAYFKYTFSKQLLIFVIAWMGTRDIYIALIICAIYTLLIDYLFNEECAMCMLPKKFTNYHAQLSEQNRNLPTANTINQTTKDTDKISDEDIKKAKETLEKARNQRQEKETALFPQGVSQLSFS